MSEFEKSKLGISSIHRGYITDPHRHTVAICQNNSMGSTAKTTKEIVRRWNSHDALLEACKEIANWMHKNTEERINLQEKILDIIAKAAIATAKKS